MDKTALVTGGNKGIGFSVCKGLLSAGFRVILTARSLEKATQAAEQLQSIGPSIYPVEMDVADDASIRLAARDIGENTTHLDVLINNAGVYPDEGFTLLTISRDLLDFTMNTNAFGPVRVIQCLLPLLENTSNARIINVSSGYGALSGLAADVSSYCLSKLALNGITIMLADALRGKGVAVYAMCPGWVRTDMGGASAPRSPEQGADTAIWLATEAPFSSSGKFFRDRKEVSY